MNKSTIKNIIYILIAVVFSTVCSAQIQMSGSDIKACRVAWRQKTHLIKLKENGKWIGKVEYNQKLKKYISFAFFPFHIPYSHRRAVKHFLAELTKSSKLPGRYYIDMSNGETGYYELSTVPVWTPRDVYKLWPEIFRIVSLNTRTSTVLKTIQMFPLSERTQGDVSKMKEIKNTGRNPGEFDYDMFSVEEDLLPPEVPKKKIPAAVIDRKKIAADFEKLLKNSRFPYHSELKQAAQKRDMKNIYRIAGKINPNSEEYLICLFYAADNGYVKASFKAAIHLFSKWDPQLMMLYLRKAVDAELPEAEHFLAQYLYRFDQGEPEEIFNLFLKSYKHGAADAEASLARCYWFGFGTARNRKKGFEMAKSYLAKIDNPNEDNCFQSIARTVAGMGYLKYEKNKVKGLKLINDPVTVQGMIAANTVYFYGLYGVPQSLGEHELGGGLQPHWAHLDVLEEGFPSLRDEKIIRILKYQ